MHLTGLRKKDVDPNPIKQFELWFRDVLSTEHVLPEAASLSTASADGRPSARIVLLKDFDERGFVFYTNYESRKGREISENPHVALVFHWSSLERQVSITGMVDKVSLEESEAYHKSRPRGSQIGGYASRQSEAISSRTVLEESSREVMTKYDGKEIPLPVHWGGYCLHPETIEFWQGRLD